MDQHLVDKIIKYSRLKEIYSFTISIGYPYCINSTHTFSTQSKMHDYLKNFFRQKFSHNHTVYTVVPDFNQVQLDELINGLESMSLPYNIKIYYPNNNPYLMNHEIKLTASVSPLDP